MPDQNWSRLCLFTEGQQIAHHGDFMIQFCFHGYFLLCKFISLGAQFSYYISHYTSVYVCMIIFFLGLVDMEYLLEANSDKKLLK
jgi:hypothetical protein